MAELDPFVTGRENAGTERAAPEGRDGTGDRPGNGEYSPLTQNVELRPGQNRPMSAGTTTALPGIGTGVGLLTPTGRDEPVEARRIPSRAVRPPGRPRPPAEVDPARLRRPPTAAAGITPQPSRRQEAPSSQGRLREALMEPAKHNRQTATPAAPAVPAAPAAPAESVIHTSLGPLPLKAVDDQIRVQLPFRVDTLRLTRYLQHEGYPLAHGPGDLRGQILDVLDPTTQGWGPGYDPEGYYPYWVYPDPERPGYSTFAFVPRAEDLVEQEQGGRRIRRPSLGPASRSLLARWLPILRTCATHAGPGNGKR